MAQGCDGRGHAVVVGAGLSGALLACQLGRRGWRVTLCERRADPRVRGAERGRSINLALSCRGITALSRLGLEGAVLERAIPMPGRMMHGLDGGLTFQAYSKNASDAIQSVSRAHLNRVLLDAAEAQAGVRVLFSRRCIDADLDAPAAIVRDEETGAEERVEGDVLIGADGAFSAVRGRMQKTDRFDYAQQYLEHGYKELTIPPATECGVDDSRWDGFAIEPRALHIWPRGGFMMIALPNADRSFTCTLFWPFDGGPASFGAVRSEVDVRGVFASQFADAEPLLPRLAEEFAANPVGSLATVRCWPWHVGGRVLLLGDAAHAIVPFYGQGINCGFEDCRVLDELLDAHGDDPEGAFPAFSAARKRHADAIADLALDNFITMRDRVADPLFLLRKRVEQVLHGMDEERFTPLYNLVSFSNMPYAEARERGERVVSLADRIARRLGVGPGRTLDDAALRGRVAAMLGAGAEHQDDGEVIDISPPVSERTAVFPGDTPLTREVLLDMRRGDGLTLSTLRATVHLGAHADGPNHYGRDARAVDEQPLERYLGRCQVIECRATRGVRLRPADLRERVRERRVLLKTGTWPNSEVFNADFAGLSVELVDALAAAGVMTVGVDTPSVDAADSKDLEAHRAILRHDIAILECLDLSRVEPGVYELVALPLRLVGFDASPVRAVLRS